VGAEAGRPTKDKLATLPLHLTGTSVRGKAAVS